MAKIRKIYSSVWGEMGQKEHFWQKNGQILTKKIENENFTADFFCHFLKDQKIGSYGKNQENL